MKNSLTPVVEWYWARSHDLARFSARFPILHPLARALYRQKDKREDGWLLRGLRSRNWLPTRVYVQISRRCNLQCAMCGWKVWQRNKGTMSPIVFERVVAEMKKNGIRYLDFTAAQGEPLLCPDARDYIFRALEEGFIVSINSNCTTLGTRNIETLVDAAFLYPDYFSMQVSFSGYDKQTHESVYVGSDFELTSKKLAALYAALKQANRLRTLTVNGVIMNASAKQKHLDYLATLGIDPRYVRLGLADNFAGIVDTGPRYNGISSHKRDLPLRGLRLCPIMTSHVVVYDDGSVSTCSCRDSEGVMALGSIDQGIRELRDAPVFKGMVEDMMAGDLSRLPLCRTCDIPYGDQGNIAL